MKCTHDLSEMDTAAHADGLCPLCLLEQVKILKKALSDIGYRAYSPKDDDWIWMDDQTPIGLYLDQVFAEAGIDRDA